MPAKSNDTRQLFAENVIRSLTLHEEPHLSSVEAIVAVPDRKQWFMTILSADSQGTAALSQARKKVVGSEV